MAKRWVRVYNRNHQILVRVCVTRSGQSVHLRPQSYEVLKYLVENKGHLISKDTLILEIWQGRAVTDGSLGKCIEEVRVALGTDSRQYLRNVRGRGYIFDPEETRENGKRFTVSKDEIEVLSMVLEEEENGEAFGQQEIGRASC